jgi:hypothetical protein
LPVDAGPCIAAATLQIGQQAQVMGAGLRRLVGSAGKSKTTIIFINQLHMKVGSWLLPYHNPILIGWLHLKMNLGRLISHPMSNIPSIILMAIPFGSPTGASHGSCIHWTTTIATHRIQTPFSR